MPAPPVEPGDAASDPVGAPVLHAPDDGGASATGHAGVGTTPPAGDAPFDAAPAPIPALSPEAVERSRRALGVWLIILLVFGVGGVLFGQQEMALMVAISGVVIAAHAADFHPRFELLYRALSVVLIGMCGVTLLGLAAVLRQSSPGGPLGAVIPSVTVVFGLLMFATGLPRVGMGLARFLFGARGDSHSFRLAARLTLFGFLLAIPGWFAAQMLLGQSADMTAMFKDLSFGGAVFGYIVLALAAVGFLIRRDLRSTLERLGLTRPRARDLLLVAIGVPVLWGLNSAGEWGQQHWFHSLWESDRRFNESLVGALDHRAMLALALTAGIGEEITMRGALQPKLGLVRTSLFFAALHVQYSWYGMTLIFALGLVLGIIRKRSNTAVAMAVHAIYDLLALIAT
jgi:hypothetical protein